MTDAASVGFLLNYPLYCEHRVILPGAARSKVSTEAVVTECSYTVILVSDHACFSSFNSSQSYRLSCKFFLTCLIHLSRGLPHGRFPCTLMFDILCGSLPFSILFRRSNHFNLFFSMPVVNFSTFSVSLMLSLPILSLVYVPLRGRGIRGYIPL